MCSRVGCPFTTLSATSKKTENASTMVSTLFMSTEKTRILAVQKQYQLNFTGAVFCKGSDLMRRTMVVSVFAGCGKTWLVNHQNKYGYSMRDSDSSTYEKTAGWEKEYINSFMEEAKSGKYDFIFVCQTESVIDEMDRQKIPYVIVEPDNIVWNKQETEERAKERQIIKQQWFGRFVLRNNSHIKDFSKWLSHMKDIYDERTGLGFIVKHNPVSFFVLKQNQYLSDIIDDLYWKKQHCDAYIVQMSKLKVC